MKFWRFLWNLNVFRRILRKNHQTRYKKKSLIIFVQNVNYTSSTVSNKYNRTKVLKSNYCVWDSVLIWNNQTRPKKFCRFPLCGASYCPWPHLPLIEKACMLVNVLWLSCTWNCSFWRSGARNGSPRFPLTKYHFPFILSTGSLHEE